MKSIILIFTTTILVVIGSSCSNNTSSNNTEKNEVAELTANFDWLLGNWIRTNEEEGKQTFENWRRINEFEYEGFGWTVQNGDTIFQEKIKLYKSKDSWFFGVISPEETEYTNFKVIEIGEESFTCENPQIDFPRKIQYSKDEKAIKAKVSGKDMEITFEFKRI